MLKFDDAWDGVRWETVDQGTLETGQSLRHICAKEGGENIERSMQEAVSGGRGLSTARRRVLAPSNRDRTASKNRLVSGGEEG